MSQKNGKRQPRTQEWKIISFVSSLSTYKEKQIDLWNNGKGSIRILRNNFVSWEWTLWEVSKNIKYFIWTFGKGARNVETIQC